MQYKKQQQKTKQKKNKKAKQNKKCPNKYSRKNECKCCQLKGKKNIVHENDCVAIF